MPPLAATDNYGPHPPAGPRKLVAAGGDKLACRGRNPSQWPTQPGGAGGGLRHYDTAASTNRTNSTSLPTFIFSSTRLR